MRITTDKAERRAQRAILEATYPDYRAPRHDVYVLRYMREQDARALADYERARGLAPTTPTQGEPHDLR